MAWYTKNASEVEKELGTDINKGITEASAGARTEKYGKNIRIKPDMRQINPSMWRSVLIVPPVIFLAAAALYAITANYAAMASVICAAAAAFAARLAIVRRADRLSTSIASMISPVATVLRDGARRVIDASALVPGDVVILRPGDEISADMRIVESSGLRVDESSLPGGFISAEKNTESIEDEDAPISSRACMLYCGCSVMSGYAKAIVCETGTHVEPEDVKKSEAKLYFGQEAESKLLARKIRHICYLGAALCLAALGIGLAMQEMSTPVLVSTVTVCATMAAAVLPATLGLAQTAVLTYSMRRLAKRGAAVKNMRTMSQLDRIDTLVLPKTGVVTSEEMTATVMWSGGRFYDISGRGYTPVGRFDDGVEKDVDISRRRDAALLLMAAALCANSDIEEVKADQWEPRGDATECALVTLAAKAGLFRADMNEMFPRIGLIPFEPQRRRMTSIHRRDRNAVAYSKGAPELMLASCSKISVGGRTMEITDANREQITEIFTKMSSQGLRVLAVAYKDLGLYSEYDTYGSDIEQDMVFLGVVGIENRIAHSSVSAFNLCESAKIRPVIISGDEIGPVSDAALSLGIHEAILDCTDCERLSVKELASRLRLSRACAKVTTAGKSAVMTALKTQSALTAACGVTASDAAAISAGDIGFAVGSSSVEAARKAADVIVDDQSFSEIVKIIEESRRAFAALRAYTVFALAAALTAILSTAVSYLASVPAPLSPVHFVWIYALLSLIESFVLRTERGERNIMRGAPRPESETVLSGKTLLSAFIQSIIPTALLVLASLIVAKRVGPDAAELQASVRTMGFMTYVFMMIAFLYSARSERTSLMRLGMSGNRALAALTLGAVIAVAVGVFVPFARPVFSTVKPKFTDFLIALGFAAAALVWNELYKMAIRPIIDKYIKVKPSRMTRRERRLSFGESFFSHFEDADPTQDESSERSAKTEEPETVYEPEIEDAPETFEDDVIEPDENEQIPQPEEADESFSEDEVSEVSEEDIMQAPSEATGEVEEIPSETAETETAETEEASSEAEEPEVSDDTEAEEPEKNEDSPEKTEE